MLQLLQLVLKHFYAPGDIASIQFQLLFARAAGLAEAAALTLQVRPAAHEPRRQVLELRELDLELTFEAARTLSEDVQYHRRSIEHTAADGALEVALLTRGQRVIEERDVAGVLADRQPQGFHLAAADERARFVLTQGRAQCSHDLHARRPGELIELLDVDLVHGSADADVHEKRALSARRTLEQPPAPQRLTLRRRPSSRLPARAIECCARARRSR